VAIVCPLVTLQAKLCTSVERIRKTIRARIAGS
jgi:hypothetical protein